MTNKKYYEAIAGRRNIWEVDQRSDLYFQERLRYDSILESFPKGATDLLDLGCGDGYLAHLAAKKGLDVTAFDLSANRLGKFQEVAARYHIKQVIGNVCDTAFAEESFDLILCSEVIEHIPNYHQVLREAFRLLRPHGTLIVTVPYKENLKVLLCPHCQEPFHENGHLHRFDKDKMTNAMEKIGFTLIKARTLRHRLLVHFQYHTKMRYGFLLRNVDKLLSAITPDFTIYLLAIARPRKP